MVISDPVRDSFAPLYSRFAAASVTNRTAPDAYLLSWCSIPGAFCALPGLACYPLFFAVSDRTCRGDPFRVMFHPALSSLYTRSQFLVVDPFSVSGL